MTTQTLTMAIEEANEYPTLRNFELLYDTNKLEVLSEALADAVFAVRPVTYDRLSESEQQRVKVIFFDALNAADITITLDLINIAESRNWVNMASLLRQYGYSVPFNSEFSEVVETLQPEQKVTLVTFTEFGFPVSIQTTVTNVTVKPYAQYKEALEVSHKPKGKRNIRSNRFLPYSKLIVYPGWVNIDIDGITKNVLSSNDQVTVTQSKYGCFDPQYMADIMTAVDVKPAVSLNVEG